MKPQLLSTHNYDLFKLNELNRDIKKIENLKQSMKRYGFRPHKSIDVIKTGSLKLIVTDGHHRLVAASELGLAIWYTVADNCGMTIQEEQSTTKTWSLVDYLISYTRLGKPAYLKVKEYIEETGIPLVLAISILAGESAGSGNKRRSFKSGLYKIGEQTQADDIKDIVNTTKAIKLKFATNSFFVQAISKCLWVDAFSASKFKEKIKKNKNLFEKQPDVNAYLAEIEKIYNRGCQDRIPLAFLSVQKSKERKRLFGN